MINLAFEPNSSNAINPTQDFVARMGWALIRRGRFSGKERYNNNDIFCCADSYMFLYHL